MAIHSWIGRFVAFFIILAVLYGGLLLAGRTEGFRSLIAQRWTNQLGIPIQIASSSLTPAFELRLRGITTKESPDSKAATSNSSEEKTLPAKLQAQEVRLQWSLWKFRCTRTRIKGARVDLVLDPVNGWLPPRLAQWAKELDAWTGWMWSPTNAVASSASASALPPLENQELDIEDVDVVWHPTAEGPTSSVEKFFAYVTPLHPPGRTLTHVRMGAAGHRDEQGTASGPFAGEWILYDGKQVRLEASLPTPSEEDIPFVHPDSVMN